MEFVRAASMVSVAVTQSGGGEPAPALPADCSAPVPAAWIRQVLTGAVRIPDTIEVQGTGCIRALQRQEAPAVGVAA